MNTKFQWLNRDAAIRRAVTFVNGGTSVEATLRAAIYTYGNHPEELSIIEMKRFKEDVLKALNGQEGISITDIEKGSDKNVG